MGYTGFDPIKYKAGVDLLKSTGATFARSHIAAHTGRYEIADILDPRHLKNGMREACFADGFDSALPVFVSIDGTGSMQSVPHHIQGELSKLIDMLVEQGISDHPNVLFTCHDDEYATPPDALFQMSQFETAAPELLAALNEMIIPGAGGSNDGEGYHLSFYAAAFHTKIETYERNGSKGFFFMVCDEQPYYDNQDPRKRGTSPKIAAEVFGDAIEREVTMFDSVKETLEKYHVFIIRPGHTSHGRDKSITRSWQTLLSDAGGNPEYVLEIAETEAIIPTIALSIGRLHGEDADEMVDVLRTKGVGTKELTDASAATMAIVPISHTGSAVVTTGQASARFPAVPHNRTASKLATLF